MQQRHWTTADDKILKVMRRSSCQGEKVKGILRTAEDIQALSRRSFDAVEEYLTA